MKRLIFALALICISSSSAFAVSIFKGDTEYKLDGSFKWGDFGTVTFTDGSSLYYDTQQQKLKIDATLTSSKYAGEKFDLNVLFGQISLANKASDNPTTSELDVSFPSKNSMVKFGILPGVTKGGMTMIGTLEPQTQFNYLNKTKYPLGAGFDIPVLASMPLQIYASNNTLYLDAWIRAWGDLSFTNGKTLHIDIPTDLHTIKLTPVGTTTHTNVPEPMSMSLLATGLFGAALAKRRRKA